ncbi:MAG: serine/threonine-protein kinase [Pirellulaceae bacterium]
MINQEDYRRVCEQFAQLVELPAARREELLAAEFADRPDLADQVRAMILADPSDALSDSPVAHLGKLPAAMAETVALDGASTSTVNEADYPAIPGYDLEQELGRGGMGIVFRARQHSPGRKVAIKMILAGRFASSAEVERFQAEAEAAANLSHSGIVPLFEVGRHEGRHYFTMAYIDGPSLATVIQSKSFDPTEAAELILKIATALAHAHDQQIVHRDLKPSNILLDEEGEPWISDFGLAKQMNQDLKLTHTGQIVGTPGNMAPEQAMGQMHLICPATDVYGLGTILYTLLTGRSPFQSTDLLDAIEKVCNDEVVPPRRISREIPRNLETICLKCLHKSPGARYANARELADDLAAFLRHEPIQARPLRTWERIVFWARRKPGLAVSWAGALMFFLYHLMSVYLIQDELSVTLRFRVASVVVAIAFAGGAWIFQRRYENPRHRKPAIYQWMTWNVLLLTILLFYALGVNSPLTLAYLLMIASSGTLYERGLVGYVTAIALAGYLLHVATGLWLRSEVTVDFHQTTCMLISILALGMIQYFVVRRIRASNQ